MLSRFLSIIYVALTGVMLSTFFYSYTDKTEVFMVAGMVATIFGLIMSVSVWFENK